MTAINIGIAGLERHAVAQLLWWALHVIGRWRQQRTSLATLQRQLRAADCVDHDAGAVGRVLDRQSHLELDRRPAEAAPLEADEADLVVLLPWHIVGRTDMDIPRVERLVEL